MSSSKINKDEIISEFLIQTQPMHVQIINGKPHHNNKYERLCKMSEHMLPVGLFEESTRPK